MIIPAQNWIDRERSENEESGVQHRNKTVWENSRWEIEISIFGLGNLFSLFLAEKKLEDHCTCFIVVEYNYVSKLLYNHI